MLFPVDFMSRSRSTLFLHFETISLLFFLFLFPINHELILILLVLFLPLCSFHHHSTLLGDPVLLAQVISFMTAPDAFKYPPHFETARHLFAEAEFLRLPALSSALRQRFPILAVPDLLSPGMTPHFSDQSYNMLPHFTFNSLLLVCADWLLQGWKVLSPTLDLNKAVWEENTTVWQIDDRGPNSILLFIILSSYPLSYYHSSNLLLPISSTRIRHRCFLSDLSLFQEMLSLMRGRGSPTDPTRGANWVVMMVRPLPSWCASLDL